MVFVAVEGIDGAGKSTLCRAIAGTLAARGFAVTVSAEPTGGTIGRVLRRLSKEGYDDDATIARLFAADRYTHVFGRGGMMESIKRGEIAITDRYVLSSIVYNGSGGGENRVRSLNAAFPVPDLLVLVDTDVKTALKRISGRSSGTDAREVGDFLTIARRRFLELAPGYGRRFLILGGDGDPDSLARRAAEEIEQVGQRIGGESNLPGRVVEPV